VHDDVQVAIASKPNGGSSVTYTKPGPSPVTATLTRRAATARSSTPTMLTSENNPSAPVTMPFCAAVASIRTVQPPPGDGAQG
jgi:hypothetical protein